MTYPLENALSVHIVIQELEFWQSSRSKFAPGIAGAEAASIDT